MRRLILLLSSALVATGLLNGQVTIRCETGPVWKAGEFNRMKISVTLNSNSGLARFRQDFPVGIEEIVPEELLSGDMSWYNSQLNIVWLNIPANRQMTFSYLVRPSRNMSGTVETGGMFTWIREGRVKEVYEMPPVTVQVIPAGGTAGEPPARTENVSAVAKQESGSITSGKSVDRPGGPPVGIVYRIQISASSKPVPTEEIERSNPLLRDLGVKRIKNGNTYKYQAGSFTIYDEAVAMQKKLTSSGIKDAFVVAFRGENQIPLSEALKENR